MLAAALPSPFPAREYGCHGRQFRVRSARGVLVGWQDPDAFLKLTEDGVPVPIAEAGTFAWGGIGNADEDWRCRESTCTATLAGDPLTRGRQGRHGGPHREARRDGADEETPQATPHGPELPLAGDGTDPNS